MNSARESDIWWTSARLADSRTDSELVRDCLAGQQAAWRALVERYERLIFSIPRRYGLTAADCEDVMQAVFIKLYRSLERLREVSRLASWLITTTHRESWRVARSSDRYPDLDEHIADLAAPAEADAARWEREHLVRLALERLGGRCEKLLSALFLQPTPAAYDQVAADLGLRVGSIGATRARCLAKLELLLSDLGFDAATEFAED